MPDDIPSAARRIVAHARYATGPMREVTSEDLRVLLPVLEAAAAGQGDEGRVEQMARALCRAVGHDPDAPFGAEGHCLWESFDPQARAAMALADAGRAAGSAEAWRAYANARTTLEIAARGVADAQERGVGSDLADAQAAEAVARIDLDAAVRRLAGRPGLDSSAPPD